MRAALPELGGSEALEPSDDFPWLEDGNRAHVWGLADADRGGTHKLSFGSRVAVLQKHRDDLSQICPEFFLGRALTMCAREARDIADKKPGI